MFKRLLLTILTLFLCKLVVGQSISSNSPLCSDNTPTLELKATGGNTYAWTGPNGFTSSLQNPSIAKATTSQAGTYTCIIDGKTTLTTDVKIGSYNSSTGISYYTSNARLLVYAYNNSIDISGFSFDWTGPNNLKNTSSRVTINGYEKTNAGTYTVAVKDDFGCSFTKSTNVTINDCSYNPYIYTSIPDKGQYENNWGASGSTSNIFTCDGTNIRYRVDTTYWGNNVKIQWFKNDQAIDKATGLTYTSSESTTFYAQLTKGSCVYKTQKLSIQNVIPKPTVFTNDGFLGSTSICSKGGTTTLYPSNSLTIIAGSLSYQWFKDGKKIYDGYYMDVTQAGEYRVKVIADNCEAISEIFTVSLSDKPTTSFTFNSYSNTLTQKKLQLCVENSNDLYLRVLGNGNGNKTIYKNGDVWQTATNSSYPYFDVKSQPGVYVLENKQGECTTRDTLTLEYGKSTDVSLTKVFYNECSNLNYYYVAHSGLTPFSGLKWYKNEQLYTTGGVIYPNTAGVYQVKYEDPTTGCKGESPRINITVPTTPNKQIYSITSPLKKKITICKGAKEGIALALNTFASNGVWKKDGQFYDAGNYGKTVVSSIGKYWYEVNNGSNCTFYSDTLEIMEQDVPKLVLTQTCTKDNTVKLTVNKVANGNYNWYQNGTAIATSDTVLSVTQDGVYQVKVQANGCLGNSNKVNVGVSLASSTNACTGDSLKLQATGDATNTYNWTGPNNFKSVLQFPIIPKTTKNAAGIYKLTATDKAGCTFTAQTNVIVGDVPAFSLAKSFTVCAGTNFELYKQVISKPLTDSTETVSYAEFRSPSSSSYNRYLYLSDVKAKDAGVYQVKVYPRVGSCVVSTTTQVIVDASESCKSISVDSKQNISICPEQSADITFRTAGNFKPGTLFRAYSNEGYYNTQGVYTYRKVVLGTGTKSPIKASGFKEGYGWYEVYVESEDGVSGVGYQYVYTSSFMNNSIVDTTYRERSRECVALPLRLSQNYSYTNKRWLLNGDTLKNETNTTITATKTGTYTFVGKETNGCQARFSKDVVIGAIEKPRINYYRRDTTIILNCANKSIDLYTSTDQNTSYNWSRDGISQVKTNVYNNVTTSGKYVVTVTSDKCTATSDTVRIIQNPNKILSTQAYTNNRDAVYTFSILQNRSSFNWQLYKDNILYSESNDSYFQVNDSGKYFIKATNSDCELVSNVVSIVGKSSGTTPNNSYLYYSGSYDYANKVVEVCDTNSFINLYAYLEYDSTTIKSRITTAYKDGKALITPKISFSKSQIQLYVKEAGVYYLTDEVIFNNGTKAIYRYGDMTVKVSSTINLGGSAIQNIAICADSTVIYADYDSPSQHPIAYNWKKDGVLYRTLYSNDNPSTLLVKESGTYILETTYKGGCIAKSSPYKVTLNSIDLSLTDNIKGKLCDESYTTIYGRLYGFSRTSSTNVSYQVLKDGKEYEKGSFTPNQWGDVFVNSLVNSGGTYTLKAQQGKCQGTSNDLIIKSIKVPNTINYADSVLFCQGKTITLKTTQDTAISYLWEKDGNYLTTATKASLDVNNSGVYRSLNRMGDCWNYTPKVTTKALPNILPTATISGDKDINYNDSTKVAIAFTSYAPWTFKFSDGKEYTATKSPFSVSVKPQFTTTYSLTEVSNLCGTGTVSGTATIKVIILGNEPEEGVNLNVFPIPSQEDVTIRLDLEIPALVKWTLFNSMGTSLDSENNSSKSIQYEKTVSLKTLPEGTYFLQVQVGDKTFTRKLVKVN